MEFKDVSTREEKNSNYKDLIKETQKATGFSRILNFKKINSPIVSGEPIGTISFRIIKEIIILVTIIAIVLAVIISQDKVSEYLNDNDYSDIGIEYTADDAISVDLVAKSDENSTNFMLNTVAELVGSSNTYDYKSDYITPENLYAELESLIGEEWNSDLYQNTDNYSYIEQIYTLLEEGYPVIISGSNSETGEMEYAFVTGINMHKYEITILDKTGEESSMDFGDFIKYTRLNSFKENQNFLINLMYVNFNVYKENTAVFLYVHS